MVASKAREQAEKAIFDLDVAANHMETLIATASSNAKIPMK